MPIENRRTSEDSVPMPPPSAAIAPGTQNEETTTLGSNNIRMARDVLFRNPVNESIDGYTFSEFDPFEEIDATPPPPITTTAREATMREATYGYSLPITDTHMNEWNLTVSGGHTTLSDIRTSWPPPPRADRIQGDPCREGEPYHDPELGIIMYSRTQYDELMNYRSQRKTPPPLPQEIHCTCCDRTVTIKNAIETAESGWICRKCSNDNFMKCQGCRKMFDIEKLKEDRERSLWCKACAKKHTTDCPNCGQTVNNQHMLNDNTTCSWCLEEGEEGDEMDYRKNKSYLSSTIGSIIKSVRPFGVEIEAQYNNSDFYRKALSLLPKGINVGSDGSINGSGAELRTPVMSGKKGEKCITDTCKALYENGFKVDKSCGLHVHVDAHDIDKGGYYKVHNSIKSIFLFYMAFEDVILSFLPKSRRNNNYCRPLRNSYSINEIIAANSISAIEKIWYRATTKRDILSVKKDRKHGTRYHGINMHTLIAFRHIEIRFHSGTINAKKINEWINLHTNILDSIIATGSISCEEMKKAISIIDIGEKTEMFFKYLSLSNSSKQYFLARQEMFAQNKKIKIDAEAQKEVEELSAEKEA